MLIAGLTGNYGMGKSTVLGIFRELGAATIGADEIVDTLLKNPSVIEKIRGILGDSVFSGDGSLDRSKVASLIFRDEKKRNAVEGVLHPLVFEEIEDILRRMDRVDTEDKIVIIEIPLLFEKGYDERFHKKITVYTNRETSLKRLEKKGISRDDARIRLGAQMPIEEKMRMADFTIDNSGTLKETRAQVKKIYDLLLPREG